MTTYNKRKEKLINDLKDKEYRDAFVAELINVGISFQIKTIREQREWTQKQLGENVREIMKQECISRLEDPNYAQTSLTTLKRLASAFDAGLMVRFVPISDLVKWELGLTSESLKAVSFDEDDYFKERLVPVSRTQVASDAAEASTGSFCGTTVSSIIPLEVILDNQTSRQTNPLRLVNAQC